MTTLFCVSDGAVLRPVGKPNAAKLAKIKTGRAMRIEIGLPRNPRRHAMFFAVVGLAFHHWPEWHDFHPESDEHLRAWLLCKSGHVETLDIVLPNVGTLTSKEVMKTLVAFTGAKHVFIGASESGKIRAFRPKSQAFSKCSETEMQRIVTAVFEIIAVETGMCIADMKREIALDQPIRNNAEKTADNRQAAR